MEYRSGPYNKASSPALSNKGTSPALFSLFDPGGREVLERYHGVQGPPGEQLVAAPNLSRRPVCPRIPVAVMTNRPIDHGTSKVSPSHDTRASKFRLISSVIPHYSCCAGKSFPLLLSVSCSQVCEKWEENSCAEMLGVTTTMDSYSWVRTWLT